MTMIMVMIKEDQPGQIGIDIEALRGESTKECEATASDQLLEILLDAVEEKWLGITPKTI
jgi:hypothetical protein